MEENKLFITNDVRDYIKQLYIEKYINNNDVSTIALTHSLYISLCKFIENISQYNIIDKRNTLQNYLVNIICHDDDFYTTELKIEKINSIISFIEKENSFLQKGIEFISMGIFGTSDNKNNIKILKALHEIKKNISKILLNKSKDECKKEITSILEKYFKINYISETDDFKLHNKIKKLLTESSKDDVELFMNFFIFVKCDNNKCEKYIKSDYGIKNSILSLKKEKDDESIILLELLKGIQTKVIITNKEDEHLNSFLEFIREKIYKIASFIGMKIANLYSVDIEGFENMDKLIKVGGNKHLKTSSILIGGGLSYSQFFLIGTAITAGIFYIITDMGSIINSIIKGTLTTTVLLQVVNIMGYFEKIKTGNIDDIVKDGFIKGVELNPELQNIDIDNGIIEKFIIFFKKQFINFYDFIKNSISGIINIFSNNDNIKYKPEQNEYDKFGVREISFTIDNKIFNTFTVINDLKFNTIITRCLKFIEDNIKNLETQLDSNIPVDQEKINNKYSKYIEEEYCLTSQIIKKIITDSVLKYNGKPIINMSDENKDILKKIIDKHSKINELDLKKEERNKKAMEQQIEFDILGTIAGFKIINNKINIPNINIILKYIKNKPIITDIKIKQSEEDKKIYDDYEKIITILENNNIIYENMEYKKEIMKILGKDINGIIINYSIKNYLWSSVNLLKDAIWDNPWKLAIVVQGVSYAFVQAHKGYGFLFPTTTSSSLFTAEQLKQFAGLVKPPALIGGGNTKCYNISNLKQHMFSHLLNFVDNNSKDNNFSNIEECDTFDFENKLFIIDTSKNLKKIDNKKNELLEISKYDKLECLSKTNLFRKRKQNSDIFKVWNNVNNTISSDLLTTPNTFQILKESNFPFNINYQLGGGNIDETENYEFIKTRNNDVRIQYSYQIIYLLKKALNNLNNNNIYLEKKTIDEIQYKINNLVESENILSEYAKNIINAGKISIFTQDKNIIMNNIKLNKYVEKHKIFLENTDNNAIKLNKVIIKLLELV
jgi:hypothetical protein